MAIPGAARATLPLHAQRSPHSPDQHAAVDRVAEEQAHGAALDQRVAGAEEEAGADDAAEGEELV